MIEEKKFIVNGNEFRCRLDSFLLSNLINEFLKKQKIQSKKLAVALNDDLIIESNWQKTKIFENDRIEIVTPFAGG